MDPQKPSLFPTTTSPFIATLCIAVLLSAVFLPSCSAPQRQSADQIRGHADEGFDHLSREEREEKKKSGYGD